ncbi:type I-E CRISPR-associated protein Cas7/Cse4/CasC [bacterium]|nr:MAG: type I-E CRISPR-associated protein Cas7/Cse4/CasC [bacterium]
MKHIALHILQPFPPSCLNRDDVGAPKSAIFGGVTRARISSQCLKRAIRLLARENERERDAKLFAGSRTLRAEQDLAPFLDKLKVKPAEAVAHLVCESFLSKKAVVEPDNDGRETDNADDQSQSAETSTLLYFSPGEHEAIAQAIAKVQSSVLKKALQIPAEGDKVAQKEIQKAKKALQDAASKAARTFTRKDAADIAIFGRMVANDPTLNIEAAGLFSHAISTHACDNDLDFWTAVDDNKGPEEEAGAANMGHAEFNAACYYRYVALNLDLLFYQRNEDGKPSGNLCGLLKPEDKQLRQEIVRSFLRAVVLAVPTAKHTGMNANLPPEYVLGLVATGQPMQLVNAFESPIRANGQGWLKPSVDALESHFERFKKLFDLKPHIREEVRLSQETPLSQLIEKLVAHVE